VRCALLSSRRWAGRLLNPLKVWPTLPWDGVRGLDCSRIWWDKKPRWVGTACWASASEQSNPLSTSWSPARKCTYVFCLGISSVDGWRMRAMQLFFGEQLV